MYCISLLTTQQYAMNVNTETPVRPLDSAKRLHSIAYSKAWGQDVSLG